MAIKVSAINNMTSAKDSAILAFASDYLMREGVVNLNSNDIKVTEQSPNAMAVDVEKGYVYVQNDAWAQGSNQPKFYRVEIDTKTGKALTPNGSANNWIVAICIKVDVGTLTPGASGELAGTIEAIYGTPAASPVPPAIPNHHYPIAYVTYNSTHAVITNARITDLRVYAGIDLEKLYPVPIAEGTLINGIFTRTVVSGDLVIAVKHRDGTDPSSTDPVYGLIDGQLKKFTAATSITLPDATNYYHSGDTGFATFPRFYGIYLGLIASSGVMILGVALKLYGTKYSHFSATNTNSAYMAISSGSPASSDKFVLAGYFNATLSASAAFTWSVPSDDIVVTGKLPVNQLLKSYAITPNVNIATTDTNIGAFTIPEDGWYRINVEVGITNQSVDAEERLVEIAVKKGSTTLKVSDNYIKNVQASFNEFTHCSLVVPPTYFTTGDTLNIVGTAAANNIFKTTNNAAAHTCTIEKVDFAFVHA